MSHVPTTVKRSCGFHSFNSWLSDPHPEMLRLKDMIEQKINIYLSKAMFNVLLIPNAGVVFTKQSLYWLLGALITGCL